MTLRGAVLALVIVAAGSVAAAAETKLTDFNGEWRGTGQDRESMLQSLQDTICRNRIRADLKRMQTEMICIRKSGLSKRVRLTVVLEGNRFTGEIMQKTTQPGRDDSVINGTIEGQKTDNSANFRVTWKGATPNTSVDLTLNTPTSYSMRVTALGITVMDVTFNRQSQ
jgi:hypothetical protein